jgi:hypothetical protein
MIPMSRRHAGIETAVGALILVVLVLGYAWTLRSGASPPGHPWAALTLIPMSGTQLQAGARRADADRPANRFNVAATFFSLLTLACWVLAIALR